MIYEQKFKYDETEIKVEIEFSKRKHLSIIVYPDSRVIVKAPLKSQSDKINSIIQKKLRWITKKLDYFDKLKPILPPREYINGEIHYYLGRPYKLRILSGKKTEIEIIDGILEIKLPNPDDKTKARKIMMNWYSDRAKELLPERILEYSSDFLKLGAAKPEIRFRRMKRRWGSCSNKNIIVFNTELIKVSFYCMDYVVIHELCHLIHHSHSKKFYTLLQTKMPDWKERKKQLEKMII